MNKIISLLSCLLCAAAAFADGTVKGHVYDKLTNEVVQFVNVRLTHPGKTDLVKGAITDATGAFTMSGIAYGKYELTISYIGYKTETRLLTLTKDKPTASFSRIYIDEDSRVLDEVKVTGQRSQMKLEVDRKTFTVDQVLAAAGGSASDLLENIPSVEITTDGEISLRGNSSVEVWINGKASGLTADNRGDILQQIPAESIEKVEVIDNPSAKFSAEGSAGIINIVLKRDRKAGYYGSLRAGTDTRGGWNTGGSINYSSGSIDASANIGYRKRENKGGGRSQQNFLNTGKYQNYESENERGGNNLFARAGLTWHMTKNDDLALTGMTMLGEHDSETLTPYHYGTAGDPTESHVMFRRNSGTGDMRMLNAELAYTHRFTEKHLIDFSLSYNQWKHDNDNHYQDSTWYVANPAPTTYNYQFRPMKVKNRSWEIKLDYSNQIAENFKVEAGYNGKLSHDNSPQQSWEADNWTGSGMTENEDYFNRFIYDMDTHAMYATVTTKIGKLGVMAGLRGEYWRVETESFDFNQENNPALRDAPFKKDYFQLFPSLFLNYHLNETSQLQLNYTRRLRRPWGGQLNSFKNTSDASMVSFGNPLLTPEYTNSFSLNYLKTWDNHTISVGTYYRPTTDVIQRITYNSGGTIYSTSENVAKSQSAGMELIVKNKLFRILDLTSTVNAYYFKLDGFNYVIDNQTVSGASDENFSWDARILASLMLPYDISLQATGNYRSKRVITQGYRKPNASLDLGLRKTFFNKMFSLAVNWRDVFGTRKWENHTFTPDFDRWQENWRDPRVNFVLTWNFGNMKGNKRPARQMEEMNGGDDMQNYGGYEQ